MTVRESNLLDDAVVCCREQVVEFYAIISDFPEEHGAEKGFSRKIKADLFIDDRNLGGLPDWGEIYNMINTKRHLQPVSSCEGDVSAPRKLTLRERLSGWSRG